MDDTMVHDLLDWNDYWKAKKSRVAYDLVAEFYRRFLIRPLLNHMIRKHYRRGADVLHAGCGSGQVDADIRDYVSITGLDISPAALSIYRRENGESAKVIQGSIFDIPLPNASKDGIYNLGVMEHFTEAEILKILAEFRRVLKPDGKLIVFWPPEFGLSVLFFKVLRASLKFALRRDFRFHPDEICRLRSRDHAYEILQKARFTVVEYSFGPRDVFTYSMIVAQSAEG